MFVVVAFFELGESEHWHLGDEWISGHLEGFLRTTATFCNGFALFVRKSFPHALSIADSGCLDVTGRWCVPLIGDLYVEFVLAVARNW